MKLLIYEFASSVYICLQGQNDGMRLKLRNKDTKTKKKISGWTLSHSPNASLEDYWRKIDVDLKAWSKAHMHEAKLCGRLAELATFGSMIIDVIELRAERARRFMDLSSTVCMALVREPFLFPSYQALHPDSNRRGPCGPWWKSQGTSPQPAGEPAPKPTSSAVTEEENESEEPGALGAPGGPGESETKSTANPTLKRFKRTEYYANVVVDQPDKIEAFFVKELKRFGYAAPDAKQKNLARLLHAGIWMVSSTAELP